MASQLFKVHVGKCLKNQGDGLLDGCQAFLSKAAINGEFPLDCLGCGCIVTMHARAELSSAQPASVSRKCLHASSSQAGPSASLARSEERLGSGLSGRIGISNSGSGNLMAQSVQLGDLSAESPAKVMQSAGKRKTSGMDSVGPSVGSPIRSSPRLAEKGSASTPKRAKVTVDPEALPTAAKEKVASPHDENLRRLQAAFSESKFGAFRMVMVKDDWRVHCVACNADLAPGAEREKLGNVKKHIEGQQKKKDAVSKHMLQVASYAERMAAKDEKVVKERQSMLQRRKQLLALYREEGAASVTEDNYMCNICNHRGTWNHAQDTLRAHFISEAHKKAKARADKDAAAAGTDLKRQAGIAGMFAKAKARLTEQGVKLVEEYSSVDPMTRVPMVRRKQYFDAYRCHGLNAPSVSYGGVSYDVAPVLADLHPGAKWYPDPHYVGHNDGGASLTPRLAEGTFWHKECEGFKCRRCPSIAQEDDFRKRVTREAVADVKRGERVCHDGVNLDYLQRKELKDTAAEWRARYNDANSSAYHANLSAAALRAGKVTLQEKLNLAVRERQSLPEVAQLFKRAVEVGCFDDRPQCLNFLIDLARNAVSVQLHDGKAQGKRYEKSTKLIYEMILKHGGPQAHNFVSVNLHGPVLNTTRALFRKEAYLYHGGFNESVFPYSRGLFLKHLVRLGIATPIPFELSEDETGVIRLATWNRRTDTIDGFCGELTANPKDHTCNFAMEPVSAASYDSIIEGFKTKKVGSHLRLLNLQPLVSGVPKCVVGMFSTCMRFGSTENRLDWERVDAAFGEHLSEVGKLVCHGSDGAAVRRKLMEEDIEKGTYGLSCPSFTKKAKVNADGFPVLHDQDAIHGGKKSRNQILSSKNLYYGGHLATKNHLVLVRENFSKEEHGLNETDIDVKDKQNFPAVERIAFPQVRACLEKLDSGFKKGDAPPVVEDVKGTIVHLEILTAYLDVFFGRKSLVERIKQAGFVSMMLYLGTAYIRHQGHGHNLKENWLTRECVTDMLIGMHFAVNLIRLFRDKFSHLPVCLEKTGSDCCEDTFSDLGSEVVNKHNYTYGEALERAAHIGRTDQIRVDEAAPLFPTSRRRHKNWHTGNPIDGAPGDMSDYASVSEAKCEEAWEAGVLLARQRAECVGMKDTLVQKGQWAEPWSLFKSSSVLQELRQEDDDEESDGVMPDVAETRASPVGEATVSSAQPAAVGEAASGSDTVSPEQGASREAPPSEGEPSDFRVTLDLRLALLSAVQSDDGSRGETSEDDEEAGARSGRAKVATTVDVPGKGPVYKMRLISQLNDTPEKLSLDRLRRVRQRAVEETLAGSTATDGLMQVALFSVVSLWYKIGSDYCLFLARVQKMYRIGANGSRVDYQRPVLLTTPRDEKTYLICRFFTEDPTSKSFKYGGHEGTEKDPVPLTAVITPISSLVQDEDTSTWSINDRREREALEVFEADERQRLVSARVQRERRLVQRQIEAARPDPSLAHPERTTVQTRGGRRATRLRLSS